MAHEYKYNLNMKKTLDIKKVYDKEASQYEKTSRAVNIFFDEALAETAKQIKIVPQTILDVCCGTGILTEKVARLFPNAQIYGIDFSSGMLDVAKRRLEKFKFKSFLCDITDSDKMINLDIPLSGVDLVISSFGIHNVHSIKNKQKAVNNILRFLKAGGQFITCDLLKGNTKEEILKDNEFQRDWLLKSYSEKETKNWLDLLAEEDDPETLEDNFNLLREAGLKNIHLVWQKKFLGIWTGNK